MANVLGRRDNSVQLNDVPNPMVSVKPKLFTSEDVVVPDLYQLEYLTQVITILEPTGTISGTGLEYWVPALIECELRSIFKNGATKGKEIAKHCVKFLPARSRKWREYSRVRI
ncbi:hypothetical protein L5515_004980 [Caenorhabditis briggsae]|uniref:Uncharacterized protein n=1 Tax=Caenorhabditis briggsae TaxID=6238 RepID=A0AAE9EP18_CAEBR|nr:hypothetical protein L5515_004980 [Caenorhabditis briggsae]